MGRNAILALALIATMAIGVASTSGAVKKYPTKILVADFTGTSNDGILDGALQTNRKCSGAPDAGFEEHRVRIQGRGSGLHERPWAWAFRGQFGPLPSTIKIEIAKAKLRNRRGEVASICKPDTVQLTLFPPQ